MKEYHLWDKVPGLCEIEPILEYYPSKNKTTDATVIILPGGGFHYLAEHEGKNIAERLNEFGMDAFVCKYRVYPHTFPLPLLDARRAIRFVRSYADMFSLNPQKIAIMGFSAGGCLGALASTYTKPIEFENVDALDTIDFMPNATILCYSVLSLTDLAIAHTGSVRNLLGENLDMAKELDPILNVSDKTPNAFIWHNFTDKIVDVTNSLRYAEALKEKGKLAEVHIFTKGHHGTGLTENDAYIARWQTLLKEWLQNMSWL